ALEDPGGTGEPVAGEEGSDHAAVSAPARMHPLRPRALAEVLDDAGRLAAADSQRVDELILVDAVDPAGGYRRREARRERGGMEMTRVEAAGHREADAAHHLDGSDRGFERRGARGTRGLGDGQRRRYGGAARVDDGVLARVVEVEAVGERGVGQHRA